MCSQLFPFGIEAVNSHTTFGILQNFNSHQDESSFPDRSPTRYVYCTSRCFS